MRRLVVLVLASTSLAAAPAQAQAQDRSAELAALRAQLSEAQATIHSLEQRLTTLEGRVPSPAPSDQTNHAASGSAEPPAITQQAANTPNLRALPSEIADHDRTWELAPPGPLDRALPSGHAGSAAAFELVAGTGGGRASFALTSSATHDRGPQRLATPVVNDTFNLTFSAPLAKEGDTPFATLDGLATGTKLEFGYTQFRGHIPTLAADAADPLLQRARARCRAAVPRYEKGCTRLDKAFMDKFFTDDERDQYERRYARASILTDFAWSVRAALGYDKFGFYPVPGLAKTNVNRLSWSVGAGITLFPVLRSSFSLDVDYERSFDARKAVTTCPVPTAGATTVSCVPGPLLGPQLTDKLLVAPEFRYLLPISDTGLIQNLGFGPRLEVDILSGDVAVDVPVYFAMDDKGGLTGGIRGGYDTRDHFKFGIFIGKKFSISR